MNYLDRAAVTVSGTPGTGAITIGAAKTGPWRTMPSGADGLTYEVTAVDGSAWEVFESTYTHSGTSLSRGTLLSSSTGSRISLTSAAECYITAAARSLDTWDALAQVLHGSEVSITGAATATIDRMHVCNGTSSNYTVTLPAVSGNAGKLIGFRMDPGLTKLVTLDGNASETIDGSTTRIMWADEKAILYCNGSAWFKLAGVSKPLALMLQRTTVTGDQSFTSSTWTACETSEVVFGTTLMQDATNKRIKIVRPGRYLCVGSFYCAGTSIITAYGNVGKNQAANTQVLATIAVNSSFAAGSVATVYDCAVDDYIVASAYLTATSPRFESDAPTSVVAFEQPSW